MTEFERILDDAFTRLEAGERIGAILRRYPEHADALEPLLETAAFSLHAYTYFEPASPSGMARGRQRFLTEAAKRAAKHPRRRSESWLSWLQAPGRWAITVAVLVVLLIAAGTTAVVASADSLPGDLLYPVKIAAEETQLAVTRGPEARAQLHMARAERRSRELETVARRGAVVSDDLVAATVSEAEAALRELNRLSIEERRQLLVRYAEFAAAQAERLARVSDQAPSSQQFLLDDAAARYRQLAEAAQAGQFQPDVVAPGPSDVPPSRRTATPTPTRLRPTPTPTRRIRPAATRTRAAPPRPTAKATRQVRPQRPKPTNASTRPTRPQTPAIAVTRPPTTNVRPTRTARPVIRPATATPLRTRVPRPTRTPTAQRPGNVATAISTALPSPPTRTPIPSATPNTGAVRPPTATPTASPRPTREPTRPPTATPTENKRTATPTPEKKPTATPPPNAVVTAQATATRPSTQPLTPTPAIAPPGP